MLVFVASLMMTAVLMTMWNVHQSLRLVRGNLNMYYGIEDRYGYYHEF